MQRSGAKKSQNGLFNIDFDTGVNEEIDDDNDSDLEAELLALTSDNNPRKKPPKKKPIPQANLDSMVAESMKDSPSDDDISVDENDPQLLSELNEIVGKDEDEKSSSEQLEYTDTQISATPGGNLQLLEQRLQMYEAAEKHSKDNGETSKARRYGRGKNTIRDLIKQANAGKPINDDDIPPEVKITKPQPSEIRDVLPIEQKLSNLPDAEPEPHTMPSSPERISSHSPPIEGNSIAKQETTADTDLLNTLKSRNMQYKVAALKAKKVGDLESAVSYLKIAKQFEHVIIAVENGEPVDISQMPGPPEVRGPKIEQEETQRSSEQNIHDDVPKQEEPIPPVSLQEALAQCVEFYKKQEEKARSEENSSKARRIGRIIKQFEQAMKQNKAGKPVAVDDLPVPPGFPPLPGIKAATESTPPQSRNESGASSPEMRPKPPTPRNQTTRNTGNHVPNSRAEQQMQILLSRQRQFKEAALKAKNKGEITQAKEFLRTAKGFDKLIEATSCGLPVDFATLPLPPDAKSQLDEEFDLVRTDDCLEDDPSGTDILTRLEHQLQRQLKLCLTTRDHNKSLGDVAGTNRFERLALNVTKDLDLVRLAKKTPGAGIPKFHYEFKDFSIVKSFTELMDNELELSILRGINYNTEAPKEIDTYVKFSFPWPQETLFTEKTGSVKDTNNPEYNAIFTVPINRTARSCQRAFKRHAVKFEVYSRGGWFRSDSLIGVASVKLQQLETQCELHESFDLMEGRKKVGGKLEIRMRLRHPILTQEVEQLHEKWLVIGS